MKKRERKRDKVDKKWMKGGGRDKERKRGWNRWKDGKTEETRENSFSFGWQPIEENENSIIQIMNA